MLGEDRLDALQERDRDRAAHAAAVERQDPLRTRPEQVAVAGILGLEEIFDDVRRIGQIGHTDNPNSSPVFAGGTPSLAVKCHGGPPRPRAQSSAACSRP